MKKTRSSKAWLPILWYILFGLIFVFSTALIALATWYKATFNLEFKELLFTLASPLQGTGESTVQQILTACLPWAFAAIPVFGLFVMMLWGGEKKRRVLRRVGAGLCAVYLLFSTAFSAYAFRIPAYLKSISEKTTIYEDYYIDPLDVAITADGKTKNLIYIYMESMETTYANAQVSENSRKVNYIPGLTQLAQDNVSFSDKESGLGGFQSPLGTGWTIAALLATTSGIPFSFPVGENGHNTMSKRETFASGLTTLGDILEEKGYNQMFLCGSDATFGGRRNYFTQHGNYEIFDLYTAREEDYIPDSYKVWWGYEDRRLYKIAKDQVLELASKDEPFNFTMLTVDTHHVNGYKCLICPNKYHNNRLENVITCADLQVVEFINWCYTQDFMEDTVIVISGDHRRMDTTLVAGLADTDRTIYNCFINPAAEASKTNSRVFTTFDMFPTTLAAMGFTIEGDRLGLGTNLFSEKQTLAEEIGYEVLEEEINKFSDYYIREFS